MAVSAEEQARRAGNVGGFALAVPLSIPLIGDLIGLFTVVVPMYTMTFISSEKRLVDFFILTGLIFLFFPVSYFFALLGILNPNLMGIGWALVIGSRILIAWKGLAWFSRRLEGQADRRAEVGQ